MTTTIIVLSDSHGDNKIIDKILTNNHYDYAIIAGDYTCDPNFINQRFDYVVRGNNDFDANPDELTFEIAGFKFHLQHGHLIGSYFQLDNYQYMHQVLKEKKVDILIHGHTHVSKIFDYSEGIVLNPGSPTFPRGGTKKSYAKITIQGTKINCEIINLE